MNKIRLGKTELFVTATSIGALPLQRCSVDDAVALLRRCFEGGINYYDTANAYSDSEKKLGIAFEGIRHEIIISTKTMSEDYDTAREHIENSLRQLDTDYIDLLQLHNPSAEIDPDDPNSPFAAALEARKKGYVRHIGITSHRIPLALSHIASGLFETLQFPISYLSTEEELGVIAKCADADMGIIAMKALAGGLITNARAAHAYLKSLENVVPIWGVQTMEQVEEWLRLATENPSLDDELWQRIAEDREQLQGGFCRGCGYCTPTCPAEIELWNAARMSVLLRRSPWEQYYSDEWREKMERIEDCSECGECLEHCPYGLNPQELIKSTLKDWREFGRERGVLS